MDRESITFPLLASGNNGFDRELVFQIAEDSIESFTGAHFKKAILVLYEKQTTKLAEDLGYKVLEIPIDLHKEEKNRCI